jgi:hypothetical protein
VNTLGSLKRQVLTQMVMAGFIMVGEYLEEIKAQISLCLIRFITKNLNTLKYVFEGVF